MQKTIDKVQDEPKMRLMELNPTEVHRTIQQAKEPYKTALYIYKGHLLTHTQAIEMREGEK